MKTLSLIIGIILLCSISLHSVYAQEETSTSERTKNQMTNMIESEIFSSKMRTFDLRYQGVKGSPFLTEEYCSALIYFSNSSVPSEVEIKYSPYLDEIVFNDPKTKAEFIIDKEFIDSFSFKKNNITYQFEKIDIGKKKSFIHLANVLYKGKTSFYRVYKTKFVQADFKGAYNYGNEYDEYVSEEYYYIKKSNENIQKINLRKNHILKTLGEYSHELKQYISDNDLNMKKVSDVIALLYFYDSL